MNRSTLFKLEELRAHLESYGSDDKYVPPPVIPADEQPYFRRDVPLPEGFRELMQAGLLTMPSDASIFTKRLDETLELAETYLQRAKAVNSRSGPFDWAKKGVVGAEKTYGEAVKTLTRLIRDMKVVQAGVQKASDEWDKISRGPGRVIYPKGKP